MARPKKDGLDYYPFDVDFFDDDKLFDVQNEYGPLGEVIYLRLLSMIYKNSYYYKYDSLDKLAGILIKSIGNRWARDKQAVIQVIPFLAECNLFSPELMQENVLTSVGIQKRYLKATERRQPLNSSSPYRLVDENGDPLITAHKNKVNVCSNGINVYSNPINDISNTQSKVKESKENNISSADDIYTSLGMDQHHQDVIKYYVGNIEAVPSSFVIDKLCCWLNVFPDAVIIKAMDQAAIQNKRSYGYIEAILKNWEKSGLNTLSLVEGHLKKWEDKKKNGKPADKGTPNKFNDFPQREHDSDYYSSLEKALLRKEQ